MQNTQATWALSEPEIMELEGRLDAGSASRAGEDIRLCIESGADRMILDCANVPYMSGAGLRTLLDAAREMQQKGGYLAVCDLQPQVKEVFDACGLGVVIPSYEGQSEASQALAV